MRKMEEWLRIQRRPVNTNRFHFGECGRSAGLSACANAQDVASASSRRGGGSWTWTRVRIDRNGRIAGRFMSSARLIYDAFWRVVA